MESGDGLVLRLRPHAGQLTGAQLSVIAELAATRGNGAIELTGRANLQMRGIEAASLPAIQTRLVATGLLDGDAASEARRNIVLPPLAGLDPAARLNLLPLLADFEGRLRKAEDLAALPAKFALIFEDGGRFQPLDLSADLRIRPMPGAGRMLALGAEAADGRTRWLGVAEAAALPALLIDVMRRAAVRLQAQPRPRLRYLSTDDCLHMVAGLPGLMPVPAQGVPEPAFAERLRLGHWQAGAREFLVVAPPLGRLDAAMLARLAALIGEQATLRLTPWRSLVLLDQPAALLPALAEAGFIVEPGLPLLAVATCPGEAGCMRGSTPTLSDAAKLAAHLSLDGDDGVQVHVAGCAKGCAHPGAARATLVARDGRYDVVREGRADDPPLAKGLSLGDAAHLLQSFFVRTARP